MSVIVMIMSPNGRDFSHVAYVASVAQFGMTPEAEVLVKKDAYYPRYESRQPMEENYDRCIYRIWCC